MQDIEDYKKELLEIFFAQRRVIFGITLIISICAILIAFFWPPTYSANGSILVKGKKTAKSLGSIEREDIRPFRLEKEDLVSEEQILKSHNVIERTYIYIQESNMLPEGKNSISSVYEIESNLKTEIIPASNIIKVSLFGKDPIVAKTILEALIDQYIMYRMEVYNPVQTEAFLSHQVNNFEDGLLEKANELVELSEKTKLSDPQREIENNLLVKKDLEQQLNILINDAIEKNLSIELLEETIRSKNIQFFSSIENPVISGVGGLSSKLQELVAERGDILRIYHPSSEKVKVIETQINEASLTLKNEVITYKDNLSNQLLTINEKISSIEDRINSIRKRNVEVRKQQIQISRIEAEVKLLLSSFEIFSKRKEEAKINSSKDTANLSHISILSKAFASKWPVFPKKQVVIPIGVIVAFITGCSLGFLREYFDHTFKKPSDVENYAGLPVVFSIPK